jgi:hypothetical protein
MRRAVSCLFLTVACSSLAAEATAPLGGGYRAAKWGMSPDEARAALHGQAQPPETAEDGDTSVAVGLASGRRVTLWFFDERLYLAVYEPALEDGDEPGARAVLQALQNRYGAGRPLSGFVDTKGAELSVVAWDDGETEILYQMRRPSPKGRPAKQASSSLKVVYRSRPLAAERDRQAASREAMRKSEERRRVETFEKEL